MNRKRKKNRGFMTVMALALLLSGLFTKGSLLTVQADSQDAFSIQAELMPSDKETYSIRLTIENQGADWEGTVRLIADESYQTPCAYDTALSLPQGSRKQFVVRIPMNGNFMNTSGTVTVTLLDGKERLVAERYFKHLLTGQMDALSMGILSDAYSKLTYMDMGGMDFYFYNDFYPVRLVELKQGSLEDELESLTFLVVDQYNTGILTADEMEAIELWNLNGGVLLLGTGAYAEDVLSGFDDDYLGFSVSAVHAPGDDYLFDTGYAGSFIETEQLNLAELQAAGNAYYNSYIDYSYGGWFEAMGNGSAAILPYSFAELGGLDADYWYIEQEDFIQGLLENASSNARSRYTTSTSSYYNSGYDIRSCLGVIGNSNNVLGFGVLKGIIVLYVIFVGPVLYLILRMLKRRELYWVAVPVTAFLGIILVFFAGRGFEVMSTKVYSVTLKNLSEDKKSVTYLYCYDANRREWDLKMADGCEYAGPYGSSSYNPYVDDYYYHIKKVGDEFFLGVKPEANFEDSYFYLSSTGNDSGVEGSLFAENLLYNMGGISGTIVNNTNKDIKYLAVVWHDSMADESMIIFEGLAAGSSYRLEDLQLLYDATGFYYSSYSYSFLSSYYNSKEYDEASALAALGVGIYHLMPQTNNGEFAVIGVVENWDKTVDDDCSEISYGCLYTLQ